METSSNLNLWSYVNKEGVGRRDIKDELFKQTDASFQIIKRKVIFDLDDPELLCTEIAEFPCSVTGCQMHFNSTPEYDHHYSTTHRFVCQTCKKKMSSAHLLDLHLSETHDSFFQVASEKKPMYKCFVENCSEVFWDPECRREHCVAQHKFPSDFNFGCKAVRNQSKQMGKHNVKSKHKEDNSEMETDSVSSGSMKSVESLAPKESDINMKENYVEEIGCASKESIVGSKQPASSVPKNFHFGVGAHKGFLSPKVAKGKHWHQKEQQTEKPESECSMSELMDVLPS